MGIGAEHGAGSGHVLEQFRALLERTGLAELRAGIIGEGMPIPGPFGPQPLIYADYVASGRALDPVETFIREQVLPVYANSHTEASYCGAFMTGLRREARRAIAERIGASESHAVIFAGSGATAGINRLLALLGVAEAARTDARPVVFLGPYEHHSNILPWRESGAEVVEIPEAPEGGPDLSALAAALGKTAERSLKIGAFSAVSNVTGIVTDVDTVSEMLRRHGVLSVWDYAGGGPYLGIDMAEGTSREKDAVVISPHKFLGGPGASGILVVRRAAVSLTRPVMPGGATVSFVSPWGHDYSGELTTREEAGTPNIIGDIRAALAFLVKERIGQPFMDERHEQLNRRALAVWRRNPNMILLGADHPRRLPIFSFRVRDARSGGFIHHQLFTRMLSDRYGIQARGGCACAGPYAHRLLGIDRAMSDGIRAAVLSGSEVDKPGWVRLNFSCLMDDEKADRLIMAVDELARDPHPVADAYRCDEATARFHPKALAEIRLQADCTGDRQRDHASALDFPRFP